jgi:chaperonin GroES
VQPRILKTIHAEYIPAPYMGVNKSGVSPFGEYVLVRPDTIATTTSGGVQLPEDVAARHQLAAITGVVIECGDEAFKWSADRTRRIEGRVPRPGDRVVFEKYAGMPFLGEDKNNYRLFEDKCIAAIQSK